MEILFYLANTILIFLSILPLLAIIELANLHSIKRKKYVDNKKGKIVDFFWEYGRVKDETPPTAQFVVECTIEGKPYKQEVSGMTPKFHLSSRGFKDKINKLVDIKYSIDKKGRVKLYIYEEPEKAQKQAVAFLILGIISIISLVALWTFVKFD